MKRETFLWIIIVMNVISMGLKIWDFVLFMQNDNADSLALECEE